MTVCMTVCTVCSEPAESLVVQDLPTNRTKRHTNRHTNRARRLGNSYKPYIPLRIGVLESKPLGVRFVRFVRVPSAPCTVCMTVCMTVRFVGWLQRICIAAGEGGLVGCNSQPLRFFGSLLREACVPPIEGSSRLGGATAKAAEGPPQSRALLSLSSRWWCLGPDDDSLIEADILTCMHVVIHSRDTPAGHRAAIQFSCVESVLAFDGTILL